MIQHSKPDPITRFGLIGMMAQLIYSRPYFIKKYRLFTAFRLSLRNTLGTMVGRMIISNKYRMITKV